MPLSAVSVRAGCAGFLGSMAGGRDPGEALIRALRNGAVPAWAERHGAWGDNFSVRAAGGGDVARLKTRILNALPGLTADGLRALERTAFGPHLVGFPLLRTGAVGRKPGFFDAIAESSWIRRVTLASAAESAFAGYAETPDLAPHLSTALAISADSRIALGDWAGFASAIAKSLIAGRIGVVPWVLANGLPLARLPVQEAMVSVYGSGCSDEAFRLSLLVGKSRPSGHAAVRLRRVCAAAGPDAATALFAPPQHFLEACRALPGTAQAAA